jgi:hypothetical protein
LRRRTFLCCIVKKGFTTWPPLSGCFRSNHIEADHSATGVPGKANFAAARWSGVAELSPRAPLAISNDAESRMAMASEMATSTTGVFIARVAAHRPLSRNTANGLGKITWGYAGNGMAIESLIESNVSVTTRQSETEPIASVAATASVNRDDATGAGRRLKPVAPVGGVMAVYPSTRARITRNC